MHAEDVLPPKDLTAETSCNTISMENVSFFYDDKQVLDNQSFIFEKGGKYALTGPSGCG